MGSYQIQPGDTLDSIARRYQTSVRDLVRLNQIENPHQIWAGDSLSLPHDRLDLQVSRRQDARYQVTDEPLPASGQDVQALAGILKGERLKPRSSFLKGMLPAALAIQARYGLPAPVILAQAALESNWGHAAIGTYNVFGIKGSGSLGSLPVRTHEFVRGRRIAVDAPFAHYASYEEAFEAYARTLQRPVFKHALAEKHDPVRFARALQGTYATDPHYASRLISVMRTEGMLTSRRTKV